MDTKGILNSINNKIRLYRKYIHAKDPNRKINLQNDFKSYSNLFDKINKIKQCQTLPTGF